MGNQRRKNEIGKDNKSGKTLIKVTRNLAVQQGRFINW